jgi:periplasmic protein TonB
LSLKRFFIYSFAVHAVIIAAIIFIIPPAKKKAGGEFFADLISPQELVPRKPRALPAPRVRQSPPSRTKAASPAPVMRGGKSRSGKETFQGVQRSSPGEIKAGKPAKSSSFPSVSKGTPERISGEPKTETSRVGNTGRPGNEGPSPDLFDKNIIGALTKRNIEKEEKKDKTFAFDAKEYKFLIYNQRLKERIESIWHYPEEAAEKGIYGDLIIKFTIKKNGRLGAVEIVRGSGYPILDKAAMEALKEASPYWPLPDEWGMDAYTIEGNFVYTIYRSFIR